MSYHTVIYRWADPAAALARTLLRMQHGTDFFRQWVATVPEHDTCEHPWINVVEIEADGLTIIAGDDQPIPASFAMRAAPEPLPGEGDAAPRTSPGATSTVGDARPGMPGPAEVDRP